LTLVPIVLPVPPRTSLKIFRDEIEGCRSTRVAVQHAALHPETGRSVKSIPPVSPWLAMTPATGLVAEEHAALVAGQRSCCRQLDDPPAVHAVERADDARVGVAAQVQVQRLDRGRRADADDRAGQRVTVAALEDQLVLELDADLPRARRRDDELDVIVLVRPEDDPALLADLVDLRQRARPPARR
jgi:hypothetical protein